jgi:hypothetical protein
MAEKQRATTDAACGGCGGCRLPGRGKRKSSRHDLHFSFPDNNQSSVLHLHKGRPLFFSFSLVYQVSNVSISRLPDVA